MIPYTSIIDQTVGQFEAIFGTDAVLPHYSEAPYQLKNEFIIGKIRTMAEGRGDGGAIYTAESIQQRSSTILRDVRYVIDAHFELNRAKMSSTDSAEKFQSMFMRRAAKGQCFHHPYFGTREFPVEFQLWQESGDPVGFEHGHRDLGYMLYDFDYRNPAHPAPLFFRAELDDGVLDVESVEVRS